ncbi:uncharacterized protein BX664DRAFT_127378 [Halteromyces radiatus]|uniref:uncharacterized protein n=1 Tax=Halteromyces radiatus TaxID=101107 RepID=UPI00221EF6D7|nr:uncharacterized protein BX664DRAFT_127378 [Halteromyces radiatus]KAI8089102.1 hypothetical protein BX664DRAFT_127378 [Halteromyces radiatus]
MFMILMLLINYRFFYALNYFFLVLSHIRCGPIFLRIWSIFYYLSFFFSSFPNDTNNDEGASSLYALLCRIQSYQCGKTRRKNQNIC